MSNDRLPTVLVAPLNWGLGHATRCVPIIHALERLGSKVLLASDGAALQMLKAEFPHLPAFFLPSYHIRYQTHSMVWNIARQMPRITYAIRAEQWATERLVREQGVSGIISDNRYGCFSRKVPNVVLTHQIHLRVNNAALQWVANQVLRRALQKFDTVWVPDEAGSDNLSGELSHPAPKGLEVKYIGLLSRFSSLLPSPKSSGQVSKIAVILSGPEPQRTVLEQVLLEQAMLLPHKFVFVKGKPAFKEHSRVGENVELVSFLTSSELNELIQSCQVIVSRAGYSSLMDLAAIGEKKALLIPTPGQTEQEYLGDALARNGLFVCQKQGEIDLKKGLADLEDKAGFATKAFDTQQFESVLQDWVSKIRH